MIAVALDEGLGDVDRQQREILPVHVAAEVMLILRVEFEPLPEAELFAVDPQKHVHLAAVARSPVDRARGNALEELRDPNVDVDA